MGDWVSGSLMAIVPMKPFAEAKGRLADVFDETARAELSRALLARTLAILTRARGVARVAVVSRDEQVLRTARKAGAWAMWEARQGLNEALEQATQVAKANGSRAILIIPADLPRLATGDVDRMIKLGSKPPCVVVAPSRRDLGTNALLVNPTGLIHYSFGEESFAEHQRLAKQVGARVEVYRSDNVALDLDLPEDARALGKWVTGYPVA